MSRVLEYEGVSKWFGSAQVLADVNLAVDEGQIHVLVGENGAGKSTLAKIAAGLLTPDAGRVLVGGSASQSTSVTAAQEAGVSLIHQEPRLFPDLSVLENVWIDEPSRGWFRQGLNLRTVVDKTRQLLDELGCTVSTGARVRDLSVAEQQMVDMAAALRRDLRVLIVDEPTASLTPSEVQNLFAVLRRLRDRGVAIVFIGHRLEEILEISDRITVLRDGCVVASRITSETDEDELIRLMVGRDIEVTHRRQSKTDEPVALRVEGLASSGAFEDVTFEVRRGEILGLGGLVGAGRTEVLETIFGVRPRTAGSVRTGEGREIARTADAMRYGLALVPEDRGKHGLILGRSIRENIVAPNLDDTSAWGVRMMRRERTLTAKMMTRLQVKAGGVDQAIGQLSGPVSDLPDGVVTARLP